MKAIQFAGRSAQAGFSITEILVGVAVLTVSLAMAATMNGIATGGVRSSTILNDRDAQIDADIAAIRGLAESYTWCSGSGTLSAPSGATTCPSGTGPGDETYYSPAVSLDPSEAADLDRIGNPSMAAFVAACRNGSLNTNLTTAINARPPLTDLTRTVSDDANPDGSVSNRLLIQYRTTATDADPVHRTVVISPVVVAWCP